MYNILPDIGPHTMEPSKYLLKGFAASRIGFLLSETCQVFNAYVDITFLLNCLVTCAAI
ncbi:MAG: hypothetical protein IPH58_16650 [Sphingobacteriales bacterium]|nr:hypothetical protein [Sphingobacteriales bacterium]